MYALGEYQEAQKLFQLGLALTEMTYRSYIPLWLFRLGKVAFHAGDHNRATQQHQESLVGALEFDNLDLVAQNHDALGRLDLVQGDYIQARDHFQAAFQTANPLGRPPILLANMASVAELFAEEGDLDDAALLAMFITNHSASQAKVKERADRLLTRLEAELPANDLAEIRHRSWQSDLDTLAAQLVLDLGTPKFLA